MNWVCCIYHISLLVFLSTLNAQAADNDAVAGDQNDSGIHFAFATWMGTGYYQVGDRSIAILNLPFSYQLQERGLDSWGWRIKLPLSLGASRYDDLHRGLQTFTFVPGIEADIPLSSKWEIRPYAQLGVGKEFGADNDKAIIYGVGFNALGRYPLENFDLLLGGGLLLAGSETPNQKDNLLGFSKLDLGAAISRPADFNFMGRPTVVNFFVVASRFTNRATFALVDDRDESLKNILELGFSLGTQPQAELAGFKIPHLGLSYVTGDHLKGIKLNFGFPF